MLKFVCPHCKKKLQVKDELAGKRGLCPACKKMILVPAQTTTVAAGKPPAVTAESLEALAHAALNEGRVENAQQPVGTVEFTCFYCDAELKLSAELAGKQTPCPQCRRVIKVPDLTKTEPRDWRTATQQPALAAARKDYPALEGEWGTQTSKGAVSRQALVEADVIKEVREPVTIKQWVVRGTAAAITLALLSYGAYWGWGFLKGRVENRAVQLAESYLDGDKIQLLSPDQQAELHRALGEYYHRAGRSDAKNRTGLQRLQLARQQVEGVRDPIEQQALLRELLDTHLRIGLLTSDKGLEEINHTFSRVQRGPFRCDALRQIARHAIQTDRRKWVEVIQIINRNVPPPSAARGAGVKPPAAADQQKKPAGGEHNGADQHSTCVAILGQVLVEAGSLEDAQRLAEQARQTCPDQRLPVPVGELLVMLNREGDVPRASGEYSACLAAGHARAGNCEAARQVLQEQLKEPSPAGLDCLLVVAERLIETGRGVEARPWLDQARPLAFEQFRADSVWQQHKLVELAAVLDPMHADQLAGLFPPGAQQSRARLAILKAELRQGKGQADTERIQRFDPKSGSFAAAATLIARHNARQSPRAAMKWAESLEPETARPFAAIGVALGMRDDEEQ